MLKIAFFGSSPLSVECLDRLCHDPRYEVLHIVSQTDKPAGRGHKLTPTAVSGYALEHGLPLTRVDRPSRDEALYEHLMSLGLDYLVVVAYGAILPQRYLDIPRIAPINVHGSLLPEYRGATPIQSAIRDERDHTGVTIMLMSAGMDEGDILSQSVIEIDESETTGSLFAKFGLISPPLLADTLWDLSIGAIKPTPQDAALATYTRKWDKEDARHLPELSMSANLSRMRANTPGAQLWNIIDGVRYKYLKLERSSVPTDFCLECSDGYLDIIEARDEQGKLRAKQK